MEIPHEEIHSKNNGNDENNASKCSILDEQETNHAEDNEETNGFSAMIDELAVVISNEHDEKQKERRECDAPETSCSVLEKEVEKVALTVCLNAKEDRTECKISADSKELLRKISASKECVQAVTKNGNRVAKKII